MADQERSTQTGANYVYAGGRLIASGSAASGYLFHHFNQIGSTLALTDAQGQVVGRYAYDPFGKVVAREGIFTPMTFVGAWGVIEGSGDIFFMRHRYYDAQTGRFIQRDPIGFAGGQSNLYAYVANNPLRFVDPDGLEVEGIGWGKVGTGFINLMVAVPTTLLGACLAGESFCNPATAPLIPVKIVTAQGLLFVGITRMVAGFLQIYEGFCGKEHESTFDGVADLPFFDPTGLGRVAGKLIGERPMRSVFDEDIAPHSIFYPSVPDSIGHPRTSRDPRNFPGFTAEQ